MPVHIKPAYHFGRCKLTLNSVKKIAQLVNDNFDEVSFSAREGIWEITDESQQKFLEQVSQRKTLNSLIINASNTKPEQRRIALVFDQTEAVLRVIASPEQEHWLEHFIIDLKKHISAPTISQRLELTTYDKASKASIPAPSSPYCKIEISRKEPNPFIENIKANLASNAIWLIIGAILILIAQYILAQCGIDLTPYVR